MDPRKLAADMKAKALADLRAAEEMERAAEKLISMAAEHGWAIDIVAKTPTTTVVIETKGPRAASTNYPVETGIALPPPRRGGKAADPNSITSRSKSESVKIVQEKNRPVPLGEMLKILAERGIVLGGRKPNQALSANLGHCPELVATKRGWWLKDKPLPPENTAPKIGSRDSDIFGGLN